MPWLPGARVLDLFAGAGGVGLEALSRGAAHATFVERDPRALAALRENVRGARPRAPDAVARGDVGSASSDGSRAKGKFDDRLSRSAVRRRGRRAALAVLGGAVRCSAGWRSSSRSTLTKRRPAPVIGVLRQLSDPPLRRDDPDFLPRRRSSPVSCAATLLMPEEAVAKRAVYPGMFDPIHNGHVDVIQRTLPSSTR